MIRCKSSGCGDLRQSQAREFHFKKSVRQAAVRIERKNLFGTQHMSKEIPAHDAEKGTIADIKAAGECPEGWEHHPAFGCCKAAASNGLSPDMDPGYRMEVSNHLERSITGLMPEHQIPAHKGVQETTTDFFDVIRVVISADPDPISPLLERKEGRPAFGRKSRAARTVVETVAKRDHPGGLINSQYLKERVERCRRIVGWQHHPTHCKKRSLFEMKVGND